MFFSLDILGGYIQWRAEQSRAEQSRAEQSRLCLRQAILADAETLLEWRNDISTRSASHNTSPISISDHIEWLKATLANKNRKLYIAEVYGVPLGTVRADYNSTGYELSWTVSPSKRGMGVGKDMVSILARTISEPIRAEIKIGNIASIHIAEAVGMIFVREESGTLHYQRGAVAHL